MHGVDNPHLSIFHDRQEREREVTGRVSQQQDRVAPGRAEMIPYGTVQEAEAALGRTMTWAEAAWFRYSAAMPDSWLLCHNLLVFAIAYMVVPLPLLLLEQLAPAVALRYKLQPQVRPSSPAAVLRSIRDTGRTVLLVMGPYQLIYFITFKVAGIRTGLPLPSAGETVAKVVVCTLVEDYISYWIHRFLHTNWGYRTIHHVHHELTTPTAFATAYGHWAEVAIFGIAAIAGLVIVPCHVTIHWLWFGIRTMEAIETHSGYDFPFNPTKFIPFYGGAEFHDYHHRVGGRQSNYAPFFTFCDYIYGTDKGYRYHKASLAERKKLAGEDNMEKRGSGQEKQE